MGGKVGWDGWNRSDVWPCEEKAADGSAALSRAVVVLWEGWAVFLSS